MRPDSTWQVELAFRIWNDSLSTLKQMFQYFNNRARVETATVAVSVHCNEDLGEVRLHLRKGLNEVGTVRQFGNKLPRQWIQAGRRAPVPSMRGFDILRGDGQDSSQQLDP